MIQCNASSTGRRTLLLLAQKQRQHQSSLSSSLPLKSRDPLCRLYSSSKACRKKDLPPPLPPKTGGSSSKQAKGFPSPAQAKKEYLESQKRTGEFLQDPQANILRLQKEMNETKAKLLTVHDKPIWRRVVDRFKAKRHSVINLLCASMAYILAHKLHLKMKANQELQEEIDSEHAKNSELRALLRSLTTEEFLRDVLAEATSAGDDNSPESISNANENSSSSWWSSTSSQTTKSASQSVDSDALVDALRTKLQARIGDEGLEDADRKEKNIQEIWKENEKRIEETEEGLAVALAAVAAEGQPGEASATTSSSKKRVFDM